jgi:imidazolonepropionase-like amidohydrolase
MPADQQSRSHREGANPMSTRTLFTGAAIWTSDPAIGALARGDVLIDGSEIVAVGERLQVDDARVIDVDGKIVMPGLVDTHRHMWQSSIRQIAADWTLGHYVEQMLGTFGPRFLPEDVRAANLLGGLEALEAGVITVMDWSHIMNSPDHADAALEGHRASGVRAVFGYGGASRRITIRSSLLRCRASARSSPISTRPSRTSGSRGSSASVLRYTSASVSSEHVAPSRGCAIGGCSGTTWCSCTAAPARPRSSR